MPDFDDDDDSPSPIDSHARPDTGPPIDSHGDGLREAAAEISRQRDAEAGDPAHIRPEPPSLEDGNVPHPSEETTEIQYLDRQNAPEKVSLRKAATDIADYRQQMKEAAEAELDEQRHDAELQQAREQHAQQQQQPQQAQQQQQPTLEQRAQAEIQAAQHTRQQYEHGLALLAQNLAQTTTGEFADVRTMADVQNMARNDFPRYVRWDAHQKQVAAVRMEMEAAQERQRAEQAVQFQEYAKFHDDRAMAEIPELQRPEIKDQFKSAALETLRAHSFGDDELSRGYHGKGLFSLRDSRVQAVIADAVRWRMAQGRSRDVTKRPLPPVQRPGVAQGRYDHSAGEISSLSQRLGRTGNLKDAAKLLAAQRRAGR